MAQPNLHIQIYHAVLYISCVPDKHDFIIMISCIPIVILIKNQVTSCYGSVQDCMIII